MGKNTDELALDIFREIGNIGTGSAVTALSNIIGKPISEEVPNVLELNYDQLIQNLGKDDERVLGILFPVSKEISGVLLFVWKQEFTMEIFRELCGTDAGIRELDEEKLSAIKEISNIMASAYFTAIAVYIEKNIEIHVPAVSADMIGAVVTGLSDWTAGKGDRIVCMDSRFSCGSTVEASHLCFIMYQESTVEFLESLGVEICRNMY